MEVGRSQFLFVFSSLNAQETKEEMEIGHIPTFLQKACALTDVVGREIPRLFSFQNRSHCAWLCRGEAGGREGRVWRGKKVCVMMEPP